MEEYTRGPADSVKVGWSFRGFRPTGPHKHQSTAAGKNAVQVYKEPLVDSVNRRYGEHCYVQE